MRFASRKPVLSLILGSPFVVLLSAALLACSASGPSTQPTSSKTPNSTPQIETGSKYSIAVFQGEKQVGTIKLADITALPRISFTAEGKSEAGPTLMSVLALVGIKDFGKITIYGFTRGRLGTAEQTYDRSKINDKVVLDISNQGTCKFAGEDIPVNDWIIDVNKIVLQ